MFNVNGSLHTRSLTADDAAVGRQRIYVNLLNDLIIPIDAALLEVHAPYEHPAYDSIVRNILPGATARLSVEKYPYLGGPAELRVRLFVGGIVRRIRAVRAGSTVLASTAR